MLSRGWFFVHTFQSGAFHWVLSNCDLHVNMWSNSQLISMFPWFAVNTFDGKKLGALWKYRSKCKPAQWCLGKNIYNWSQGYVKKYLQQLHVWAQSVERLAVPYDYIEVNVITYVFISCYLFLKHGLNNFFSTTDIINKNCSVHFSHCSVLVKPALLKILCADTKEMKRISWVSEGGQGRKTPWTLKFDIFYCLFSKKFVFSVSSG